VDVHAPHRVDDPGSLFLDLATPHAALIVDHRLRRLPVDPFEEREQTDKTLTSLAFNADTSVQPTLLDVRLTLTPESSHG
jgi:hypothetical protein